MRRTPISLALLGVLLGLLAAGRGDARVRVELAPTGHATVPVTGEFGTHRFVFDTGAEGTAVYADFADSAGLQSAGIERVQGQTGATDLPVVELRAFMLDGVGPKVVRASKLPRRADGVQLAGIVGLDVFGGLTVDFDLPRKQISLHSPGHLRAGLRSQPVQASTTVGNLLTVPVRIGVVVATAVIDTGARKTRFNWALGKQLGWNPDQLREGDTIQGATNTAIATRGTTVPLARVGNRRLKNVPVIVADLPVFEAFGVADRPAIILGLDWLEHTRMVIDFPAKLVWFEPSS